jgi:hypothetical protein
MALAAAGCDGGGRAQRLVDGAPAAQFEPVSGGVLTRGRVLRRPQLGQRLDRCLFGGDRESVSVDAVVVDRVGVDGQSLTFGNRDGSGVYACDGGVDPTGERAEPWCATVFGVLVDHRVLDPRLDILCRAHDGMPLAYAFVQPVPGARWIGVAQRGYTEIYKVLAGLPVRIASTRDVRLEQARAGFEVTQYDAKGQELVANRLEATVAG